jgi:predicted small secreted protein
MKKIVYTLSFLLVAFASCNTQKGDISNTSQYVNSGNWKVSLFTDSGNNETSNYTGYTFTFSDNGTISAVSTGNSRTDTWSVSSSSNKFIIDLGAKNDPSNLLGELSNDWKILSSSATEIRLGDDNTTSNEFLTFSKN